MSEGYSDIVIDHFTNPRNVGDIPDADAIGKMGSPICGDVMWVYIKVKDNRIDDIKFKTFGCGAAIASSSMLTEMAKGLTIEQARELTDETVAHALGGLPPHKFHCSNLAASALQRALDKYLGVADGDGDGGAESDAGQGGVERRDGTGGR